MKVEFTRYALFRQIDGEIYVMTNRPSRPRWIKVNDIADSNSVVMYKSKRMAQDQIDNFRLRPRVSIEDDGCYVSGIKITYEV